MTVYIIAEVIIFALAYPFCIYKPNKIKNISYVVLVFMYLFGLSYFRYGIGNDYFSYINIFLRAVHYDWQECLTDQIEPGFMLLCKVISLVTTNYKTMHGIMAFLCLAPTAYIIAKYSKNIWLSCHLYVCLTFYYSSMNFIRQTLAATIILLAYKFFIERKTIPLIIVIVLASTIHLSALLVIPIYLLIAYIKPTTKILFGGMVILVLLYIFSNNILNLVAELIPRYSAYLDTKYLLYGLSQKYLVVPILYMLLMLFGYFEGGYDKKKNSYILVNSSIITFGIWFFITKHFILERFSIFVYIFVLLAVPDVMDTLKDYFIKDGKKISGKVKYSVLMVLVIIVALGYNIFGMVSGFHGTFPYETFL
ncbi:MAG: EpsG family protein [Ruminococcus sp.]|nr:EpsG family protein [Ruminococcus sp.]